jgi:ABC-2 type transport system permease protein
MNTTVYLRYEALRLVRNRRFFIFALGLPVALYFLIAGPNHNVTDLADSGISAPLYFMISLAAFGTMSGMLAAGGRIANERAAGWTRQLRISPLSPGAYFRTKIATGYLMALATIAALYLCGVSLGVSMPARDWLEVTGLMLVALIPFAALGIVMGHLLNPDAVGPVVGGGTALLAFVGGTWFPISDHGFLHDLALAMPSYWLVRASQIAVGGDAWGATGWLVVAAWSAALTALALQVYRRDAGRR